MRAQASSVGGKSLWTIGAYAVSSVIRFSTNIILSRLLAPEILGVVVIAQAVRTGAELLTDIGPEQNVVQSPHGDEERFLNTVWTLQILRGFTIASLCAAAAYWVSRFYRLEPALLIAVSLTPFLNALASTSLFSLSRHLRVERKTLFELGVEVFGLFVNIGLALWLRSVWAPVASILLTLALRSTLSYLLPHPRHRFLLDSAHARAIIHFSKWIWLSSLLLFGAIYADRLFLGRVASLGVLGIYGLARAIADLPPALASRLAMQVFFPAVSRADRADAEAAAELRRTRRHILLFFAVGIATVMAWSDWAVRILYDLRYQQAGWMLFLLLAGSWISVLAWFGEATMFGNARPRSVSIANLIRVSVMLTILPAGFRLLGLPGAVLALPASELARYLALGVAQRSLSLTFARQDALMTLAFFGLLAGWAVIRAGLGLGPMFMLAVLSPVADVIR